MNPAFRLDGEKAAAPGLWSPPCEGSRLASTQRLPLRLLLVNFRMDESSPVLAWQQAVARELARRCAHVTVLTEELGRFPEEPNLEVRLVPRAFCKAPLRWLGGKWLTALDVAGLGGERFDACFVHMNHRWVQRLWPFLAPRGVPILLWYAHGTVGRGLRLAHRLVDRVVTSSAKGFRLPSRKTVVVGQAIDVAHHRPLPPAAQRNEMLSVGRIAPRKRVHRLVEALAALRALRPGSPLRLRLVGPVLPGDRGYAARLRERIRELGLEERVFWAGPVDPARLPELYASAFVHLNVSRTGSMDKTVLEALACGCPVLTSNEAFEDLLAEHPSLFLHDDRPQALAHRILALHEREPIEASALRRLVVGHHDLESHVTKILEQLGSLVEGRCASSS